MSRSRRPVQPGLQFAFFATCVTLHLMNNATVKLPGSRWTPVFHTESEAVLATPNPAPNDAELLDEYSKTVTGVVEKVAPAVVNIRVEHQTRRGPGQAGGSGFV